MLRGCKTIKNKPAEEAYALPTQQTRPELVHTAVNTSERLIICKPVTIIDKQGTTKCFQVSVMFQYDEGNAHINVNNRGGVELQQWTNE